MLKVGFQVGSCDILGIKEDIEWQKQLVFEYSFCCSAEKNLAVLSQFILEELGVMICQQNNSYMIIEYALLSKPRREVPHGSAMVYESI